VSTIDIAAVNTKQSITIAGPVAAIAAAEARLTAAGHRCHRLPGDRAFHSRLMDAILTEFAAAASKIAYRPSRIPVASNVTGEILPVGTIVDAGYWVDHLRGQVRFASALDAVAAAKCDLLLEVGPGHVLTSLAAQQGGLPPGWPTTPARGSDADSARVLRTAFGAAWTAGFSIRWPDPPAGRSSEVPTYAFDPERFWIDPVSHPAADIVMPTVQEVPADPGAAVGTAVSQAWQGLLGGKPPVVDRNFFDDGGDSLLAVRLVARLRRELGIELSVLDVLQAPRYGEIVSRASELVATASRTS
jgi:acyl transferase domain-containing protein